MRVLAITNLFPNSVAPGIASFNRQQFTELGKLCDLEVLATLPWYPAQSWLGKLGGHPVAQGVPAKEIIGGLQVAHPRTLHLPKIGRPISAPLFAASVLGSVLRRRAGLDCLLGAWAHPDGCATIMLAKAMGLPCVVKVHGTDINQGMHSKVPRHFMQTWLPKADALVAVSSPLAQRLAALGVPENRIHLIRNGVDRGRFYPQDRRAARAQLGLPQEAKIALFVGNLIEEKGVFDLQKAFRSAHQNDPSLLLYLVGEGNARAALEKDPVPGMTLMGRQPFDLIPVWMAACDFLVLPSWSEGTPNVVLEALAAGRRVLATPVGGIPDVVHDKELGQLVAEKSPERWAQAMEMEAKRSYKPEKILAVSGTQSWADSAGQLHRVIQAAVNP